VREDTWPAFDLFGDVLSRDRAQKSADDARDSLLVPELREVWEYLRHCDTLGELAAVHKGLEWKNLTKNRARYVQDREFANSKKGLAPGETKFWAYQRPKTAWLSIDKRHLYRPNALQYDWARPKVIINKTSKGRHAWRQSAFADTRGLYCGETFLVIWPKDDADLWPLTAVLNSPIGNAFVTVHEGKREAAIRTFTALPIPKFSREQKESLGNRVQAYVSAVDSDDASEAALGKLLRMIDAEVLSAYNLPPKLERRLLDYFNGAPRQVPFVFGDYFPADFEPTIPLASYLSEDFSRTSAEHILGHLPSITDPDLIDALGNAM
jgi:hypothetical protein